mmetsp:Transcript_28642/g.77555  ORF Transcript_28642/g.77555 Transcript_28642/m.77555 type:complete len:92 (+) Transcript_28642:44-319(+)
MPMMQIELQIFENNDCLSSIEITPQIDYRYVWFPNSSLIYSILLVYLESATCGSNVTRIVEDTTNSLKSRHQTRLQRFSEAKEGIDSQYSF